MERLTNMLSDLNFFNKLGLLTAEQTLIWIVLILSLLVILLLLLIIKRKIENNKIVRKARDSLVRTKSEAKKQKTVYTNMEKELKVNFNLKEKKLEEKYKNLISENSKKVQDFKINNMVLKESISRLMQELRGKKN